MVAWGKGDFGVSVREIPLVQDRGGIPGDRPDMAGVAGVSPFHKVSGGESIRGISNYRYAVRREDHIHGGSFIRGIQVVLLMVGVKFRHDLRPVIIHVTAGGFSLDFVDIVDHCPVTRQAGVLCEVVSDEVEQGAEFLIFFF